MRKLSLLFLCIIISLLPGCNSTPTNTESHMMMKVLAHDGDAEAQCMLASAYRQGLLGLTQSDTEAFKWYERSANQGYLDAMELLSIIYITGEGVTKDLINAYLWAELAINYGSSQAIGIRRKLIAFMTKEQIAEAQKLSLEWVEKRED